jgi:hypothetical protein
MVAVKELVETTSSVLGGGCAQHIRSADANSFFLEKSDIRMMINISFADVRSLYHGLLHRSGVEYILEYLCLLPQRSLEDSYKSTPRPYL